MKPFFLWLGLTLASFGLLAGGYHFYLESNPRRVLVAVDSSYPMRGAWPAVKGFLSELERQRYTEFSLLTEKRRVHGWQGRLDLGKVSPYAPRDLSALAGGAKDSRYREVAEATAAYFLTDGSTSTGNLPSSWTVVRLAP